MKETLFLDFLDDGLVEATIWDIQGLRSGSKDAAGVPLLWVLRGEGVMNADIGRRKFSSGVDGRPWPSLSEESGRGWLKGSEG